MLDITHGVSSGSGHGEVAVSAVLVRWNMVKQELGVTRNEDAATACGVPLRTLDRLFERPDHSLIRNALAVTAATGITLEELIACRRHPALSEAV
ncbi:hypothetical protein [Salinispora arenicola]|uniref:hypothetical protein n=1 Tax=Salinispora arenicola TaxID=168697 RepID=UPI0016981306|nr:hypothetical protein [Salinispora arenicola]NIL57854.1 hypothetical protein [Salinispora arenicola]NIL62739.1 hypothetical protein [Salinispora arenicola]